MIKVVFKPSANLNQFKFNPEMVEQALTPLVEEAAKRNGCRSCHGSNLTISIDETDGTEIRGLYHCHDCNGEGPLSVRHNLDEIEKEIRKVQNNFWKVFSGR